MAKFKNLNTGNILRTDNPEVIRLMRESKQYVEIDSNGEKSGEKKK